MQWQYQTRIFRGLSKFDQLVIKFAHYLVLIPVAAVIALSCFALQPQYSFAQTALPAPPPQDFAPTNYATQFSEQGFDPGGILENLEQNLLAPLGGFMNLVKDFAGATFDAFIKPIGQIVGSMLALFIKTVMAPFTTYLMSILKWFVINPNIPLALDNGANASNPITGGQINPFSGSSAYDPSLHNMQVLEEQMKTLALDISLILFVLAIWRQWIEGAFKRAGGGLMGPVGRFIFTMALMLCWREIYKQEIMITNEMTQAIFFNSPTEFDLLNSALIDAMMMAIAAGSGLAIQVFAPVVGSAVGGATAGFAGATVGFAIGGIIGFVGLVMFAIFGGILIVQLCYLLVLKATQTAMLVGHYIFSPMYLVFYASPDTQHIANAFMKSFVEVSLWTFAWMGLFKIMVIVIASQATWGKLLIVIGILQIMIQVPKWVNEAKINPESHILDHRLAFNLMKEGFHTIGGAVATAVPQLGNWAQNGRLSSMENGRATPVNVNPSSSSAAEPPGQKPFNAPGGPAGGAGPAAGGAGGPPGQMPFSPSTTSPPRPSGGGSEGTTATRASGQPSPAAPPPRTPSDSTTSGTPATGDVSSVPTPGLITPTSGPAASSSGSAATSGASGSPLDGQPTTANSSSGSATTSGAAGDQSSGSPLVGQPATANSSTQLSPRRRQELESQRVSPERRRELEGQLLSNRERRQVEREIDALAGTSYDSSEDPDGDLAETDWAQQTALQQRLDAHHEARRLLRNDEQSRTILRNDAARTTSADPPVRRPSLDEARAASTQQGNSGGAETQQNFAPDGSSPNLSGDATTGDDPGLDVAPGPPPSGAPSTGTQPPRTQPAAEPPPPPPQPTFVPLLTDAAPPVPDRPATDDAGASSGAGHVSRVKQILESGQVAHKMEKPDGVQMAEGDQNQILLKKGGGAAVTYVRGASPLVRAQLFNAAVVAAALNKDPGFMQAGKNSVIGEQVRGRGEGWQGVASGLGTRALSGLRRSSHPANNTLYADTRQGELDANDRKGQGTLYYLTNGESGENNQVAQYLRDTRGPYDPAAQRSDEANTEFRTGPAFFAADTIPAVDAIAGGAPHYRAQLAMGTYIATAMAQAGQPLGPDDFGPALAFAKKIPSHTVQAGLAISNRHNDQPMRDLDYVNTVANLGALPQLSKMPNSRYLLAADAVDYNRGVLGGTWQQAGERVRTLVQLGFANDLVNPSIVAAAELIARSGQPLTREAVIEQAKQATVILPQSPSPPMVPLPHPQNP
jgi:hypothetical protein